VDDRRGLSKPALGEDLLEQVLDTANVRAAWKRVRANKGAPGVDGMSIDEFPALTREHWPDICEALSSGTYKPAPIRRKIIPKPNGGERLLGIPTVLDRVIQQAIAQVLTPIFDPEFSESSFGFRPKRSAHGAVKQVQRFIRQRRRIAVDLDLSKFFDRVDHDVLMVRVARRVSDKRLLRLIGKYLRAGVEVDGEVHPTREGVPQGGPLSPLLANIVLDDFDVELERRGHHFARYADDVMILVRSERAGRRVMASVTRYLERRLKLQVNRDKSRVIPTDQCTFLGFAFRGTKISWSDQTFRRFKQEVKRFTNRNWGVSMSRRLRELARYLRGWMGYFGLSGYYRPIAEIDGWIRRRIRMCFWKMWRKPRTRIRNLLKLGTHRDLAISAGLSSKGPWCLARTLSTNCGLSNAYLARIGLISVRDLWIRLAPLR